MSDTTTEYVIFHNMPGYLPDSDAPLEAFEATVPMAIQFLLDEAEMLVDHIECADGQCMECSDLAFIESLDSAEGRADLTSSLERHGEATIRLESYSNSFGCVVTLRQFECE